MLNETRNCTVLSRILHRDTSEVSLSSHPSSRFPSRTSNKHSILLFQTFFLLLILVAFILLSIPPTSFVLPFCRSRWRLAKHIIYEDVGMWLTVYPGISIRSTREGLKVFRKYNCAYLLPDNSLFLRSKPHRTKSEKKVTQRWKCTLETQMTA